MPISHPNMTIRQGIIGGLIAGLVYFVSALAITVALGGVSAIPVPLRQIAAVALGEQALAADYDFASVVVAANVVHFALSAAYGVILVLIARLAGVGGRTLIVLGAIYGLAIYALNRLVIFPALYPWFLANDPVVQSLLHALAFGAVIGAWLARRPSASSLP